jgi:hypothetical protein
MKTNEDVVRAEDCFGNLMSALSDLGLDHINDVLHDLRAQMFEELDIED